MRARHEDCRRSDLFLCSALDSAGGAWSPAGRAPDRKRPPVAEDAEDVSRSGGRSASREGEEGLRARPVQRSARPPPSPGGGREQEEARPSDAGPHDPDRQGLESLLAPPRRPRVRRSILRSARRGCSLAQARARLRFEQWPQARRVVFTDAARPLLVRSLVHRLVGTDRYLPTAPSCARRPNTQHHPRLAELPQTEGSTTSPASAAPASLSDRSLYRSPPASR